MLHAPRDILIIGGNSRLAQRLVRLLPPLRVINRSDEGPGVIGVSDYAALPQAAYDGVHTVVNCVGSAIGNVATLTRVNVEVAERSARQARAAGCRHYIFIGSLSVHGYAPRIDMATPVAPVTDYGRSKASAEAAVVALATSHFAVTVIRAPALYGPDAPGKFSMLARAMRVARVFPVPHELPQRSVLHLDNASAVVAALAADPDPDSRIVLAADHESFDLERFAAALAVADGKPIRLIRAPDAAFAPLRVTCPGIYASLFAASFIDPVAALSTEMVLPVALDAGLAEMLAVAAHSR